MGNSVPIALGNYSGSAHFPSHHQLGKSAAIYLSVKTKEWVSTGDHFENWTALYTVDGSTCQLNLERMVGKDGNVDEVDINISDHDIYLNHNPVWFRIAKTGPDFLIIWQCSSVLEPIMWTKRNRTVDARGGVTETKVYLHGSGNRAGLLVSECKKNSDMNNCEFSEEASAVTVAHYFANGSGTAFNRTESDIGLSVVAKFRVSNGNLDVTVEGPKQHPVSALFYMFDEVNRTGIWKPTMCPHCANIRRGSMFWQSDSEDSDSVPLVPCHNSQQNASIANVGRFRGKGNGSIYYLKIF